MKASGKSYDPDGPYRRKPFAVDVSEGKTHPVYRAHGYHTKVPHLAIVPSILHYTEPGDLVLDGFAGTGMTGVAAQWCGTAPESYRKELEALWANEGFGSATRSPTPKCAWLFATTACSCGYCVRPGRTPWANRSRPTDH